MPRILLLYDTEERDLARDLGDFLTELGAAVDMIPLAPDLGMTLDAKERKHFSDADGAVFLLTPGSTRNGRLFPSPSVADEMGQAKGRFDTRQERVTYLVDSACEVQAVDQRCYIRFVRGDIRSVLQAVTGLVRNLKAAGLLGAERVEEREIPAIDIADVAGRTEQRLKRACIAISEVRDGAATRELMDKLLREKVGAVDVQDRNFLVRDLQCQGLVAWVTPAQLPIGYFSLTNLGWELVRHELTKQRESSAVLGYLLGQLDKRLR